MVYFCEFLFHQQIYSVFNVIVLNVNLSLICQLSKTELENSCEQMYAVIVIGFFSSELSDISCEQQACEQNENEEDMEETDENETNDRAPQLTIGCVEQIRTPAEIRKVCSILFCSYAS